LFLKSLELQGFKSFPDKTRLNFGRGLTAVVGPNGSGKSNISDAVRWVLGEQSTKALRGIKMEDVIFNGSAGRKSYGWAEVRLFLDNTDRALPIDNDEVVVSRKYYRSGDSEYRICDKICRLRDINELFMDTGLGRDGYSLIGQGKIAEIIGAKSTQRREIFEEAAGISKYRYRKEEAERSLVQADENLLRLRDNLSALEERVGPLREQSDKAKKFLELAEEKKSLEISVWMRNLRKLKSQLQEQNSSISVFQAEYESLDTDYNKAEEYIGTLYEGIRNLDFDVENRRKEIAENEANISGLAADSAVSKNEIQHAENEIARIGSEIKELETSGSENAALAEAKRNELAAKEAERVSFVEKTVANAAEAETIVGAETENAAARAEASAELAKAEASIGHISVVLATAGSDAEQYEKRLAEMDAAAAKTGELIAANEKDLSDIGEFLSDNASRAESLQNSISGIALKKGLREKQLAAMEERRAALQKSEDAALGRAKLLQDLEDHMEGFAQSVKFVLERAKAGALRGILDPVSNILSVESKYALAVETAISGALQDVVVTDEDAARRAIGMLKDQNRGRVTFLPLTSVRGNRLSESGLEHCEGFIGLGSDLVDYDKKYDGVILSLLGRIAVADELGNAIAIAKKYGYRFRIVTLDGQLVNAGGSLTGGSSVKSAGILSRRHEIEELQAQAETYKRQLADGNAEYMRLREEISALAADSLATESELRTAKEDRIRAEAEKKHFEEKIADAKADAEEYASRRAEIVELNASAKQRTAEFTALLSSAETDKAKTLETIGQLEKEAAAVAKRKARNAEEAAALALSAALTEKDADAVRADIERLRVSEEERLVRKEERKTALAAMEASIGIHRKKIAAAEAETARLNAESEQRREQITALYAKRQEFESKTTQERSAQKNIVTRREEASVRLAKARASLDDLQKDYDRIIGELWDEYEITYTMADEIAEEITEPQKAQRRLAELRNKIKALGPVNVSAIEEYKEVFGRYEFMRNQIEDAEKARDELRALIRGLTGQMKTIFTDSFTRIAGNFAVVFRDLFGGGEAKLTLTDPDNVLESGIEIFVQPPGKIVNHISALSGGEQAFVAIAIYFAILKVSPAPFCILDEIEAALDEANVDRCAEYLLTLSGDTQFIAITHRRGTMEHADRLYGVTMQEEGVSKLLELSLDDMEAVEA